MSDVGVDLFMRWVRRHGVASDRVRPYITAAMLLADDESLLDLLHKAPVGSLDEDFLDEMLSLASPSETVELLQQRICRQASVDLFKRIFDRTLSASSDIDVLSGLMWVAGMYLDRHPGAFQLPRNLAEQLLVSDDLDHRLAGLKAFRHSNASRAEVVTQLTAALQRGVREDRWSALFQLGEVLDAIKVQRLEASVAETLVALRIVLTSIAGTDPDDNVRRAAERCIGLLRDGDAERLA